MSEGRAFSAERLFAGRHILVQFLMGERSCLQMHLELQGDDTQQLALQKHLLLRLTTH